MNNVSAMIKLAVSPQGWKPSSIFSGLNSGARPPAPPTANGLHALRHFAFVSNFYVQRPSFKLFSCSSNRFKSAQNRVSNTRAKIRSLRPSEVVNVFGRLVDEKGGNDLLQKLQSQRVNGTLDQEIRQPAVTSDILARALAYLRQNYPLDEEAAILKRIEREEAQREQNALEEIEIAKRWQPQESAKTDGIYGDSQVDKAVKVYNELREEDRQARKEREEKELRSTEIVYEEELERVGKEIQRKISEVHITNRGGKTVRKVRNTSFAPLHKDPQEQARELSEISKEPGLIKSPTGALVLRNKDEWINAEKEWWHKYQKQAMLSNWNGIGEPPPMSWTKRWGLPTLFMLTTVGAGLLLAENYLPPSPGARVFPDIPPAAATAILLIGLNVLAWVTWKVPPMWRVMNRTMLLHAATPRPIQLLGNTFSHQNFHHLAMNMVMLWFIGTYLCDQIGRGEFLAVYLAGGVFASWVSLTHFLITRQFLQATLGASGSICAIMACYLRINEGRRLEWAWFPGEWKPSLKPGELLIAMITIEIIGAIMFARKGTGSFDHFSHLGGYMAGITSAELLRRRRWRSRRLQISS